MSEIQNENSILATQEEIIIPIQIEFAPVQ
jgi:hypothetical protein